MKEKTRSLGKRLLSIVLSLSAAAGQLPAVVQQNAEPAFAVNEKSAEDLLDVLNLKNGTQQVADDDTTTNPYGKKKNRIAGSDEVLISQDGKGFLIGANSTVGQKYQITDPFSTSDKSITRSLFTTHGGWFDENGIEITNFEQKYICDLAVCHDTSSNDAKKYLRQQGYEPIDVDLNAGNNVYIYLGCKYTTDPAQAITDIIVKTFEKNPISSDTFPENGMEYHVAYYNIPENEKRFKNNRGDTNFNKKDAPYSYICYTRDPKASESITQRNAITGIEINTNENGACPGGSANDTTSADDKRYVHTTSKSVIYVKPEGEEQQLPSELTSAQLPLTKTASGFFDLNEDNDQKTQYAMVKYDAMTNTLDLGVYDALNPTSKDDAGNVYSITSTMQLGWYAPAAIPEGLPLADPRIMAMNLKYAAAVLSVHTADFNNDGVDEIVVYNPNVETKNADGNITAAGEVQVYMRTHNPGTTCYQFDENSWLNIYSTSLPLGSVPSINVGDADNDGYDDLLISNNGETQVVFGSASGLTGAQDLLIESLYSPDTNVTPALLLDTSAVVFNQKTPGKDDSAATSAQYIAVLGYQPTLEGNADHGGIIGHYVLMMYQVIKKNNAKTFELIAQQAFQNAATGDARYQMTYQYFVKQDEIWQTRDGVINFPTDLHCMNGKMFSRWLYETCLVQNIGISKKQNDYSIELAKCSYIDSDERILTTASSGRISYSVYALSNTYCYDFQTAILNSKDSGCNDGNYETTFYQYLNVSDSSNNYLISIGAYTAGNVTGKLPEMQPYRYNGYSYSYTSSYKNPMMYVIVDTDQDSRSVTYTGKHWFQYSDPEILAVLSAPPFFKDLAAINDSYADASTSFGSSTSNSLGTTESVSMSLGGYLKFNPTVKIMGIEIGGIETEIHTSTTLSQGFSVSKTTSFSINYNTSGADAVVFYSVPIECYEYEYAVDDGNGGQVTEKGIMYIPHDPCKNIKTLKEYRELCDYYPDMPKLADNVVEHTIGEPSTYPKSSKGYSKPLENPNLMNIDSNREEGSRSFDQEIDIDVEYGYDYSCEMSLSWLAGISSELGGFGIEGENCAGAGITKADSNGMSFSCSLEKLPAEAANKGYNMNCKMFVHESSYTNQKGDIVTFPVVDYLVTSSSEPPHVPGNLEQDFEGSSQNSIAMTWDYDENETDVSYFTVYRMAKTQGEEKESIPIGTVFFNDSVGTVDGKKIFRFVDTGKDLQNGRIEMTENMVYTYTVTASRSSSLDTSSTSIPTPELVASTHAAAQYPTITLNGVYNNTITMYPEINHNVSVTVGDTEGSISYCWQKRNDKTGKWENLTQYRTNTLPLLELIENEEHPFDSVGNYRCRVTIQLPGSDTAVPVYSESFFMDKKLREAKVSSMNVTTKDGKLTANIAIAPNDENFTNITKSLSTPGGSVIFKLYRGETLCLSSSVKLTASGSRTATAVFEEIVSDREKYNGIYQLVASYSGDTRFGAFDTEPVTVLIGEDKIYPISYLITKETDPDTNETTEVRQMTDTFSYYDTMLIEFHKLYNDENGVLIDTLVEDLPSIRKTVNEVPKNEPYTSSTFYQSQEITYSYYVLPTNVTVGVNVPPQYIGESCESPSVVCLSGRMLTDENGREDDLSKLVTLSYMKGTGKKTDSNKEKQPERVSAISGMDTYTTILEVNTDEPRAAYYNFTFNNERFHVNAKRMDLTIQQPTNGKIKVSMPEQVVISPDDDLSSKSYSMKAGSSTVVAMTAEPLLGYRLKKWNVEGASLNTDMETSPTIQFTVSAQNIKVSAEFEEFSGTVEIDPSFAYTGTILTPEGFENNKPYGVGTKLTFTMQGNDDYTPDYWRLSSGNSTQSAQTISGAEITVEITGKPITLYPVFVGRPCTLTYPDGLTVNWIDEFLIPPVSSGSTVPKGSKISVSGASAEETWLLNGKTVTLTDGSFEFVIEGDTLIQRQSDITITTEETTTASESIETTTSSETSKTTASSETSKTTASSETSKTTASSETSKTTASSETSKTTASSVTSETTTSSVTSETTASSVPTQPTVSTADTTQPAETTTAAKTEQTTAETTAATTTTTAKADILPGDVNNDSKVNLKDVVLVRRAIAGGWDLSDFVEYAADVNADARITLKDAVLIRRFIAGGWGVELI